MHFLGPLYMFRKPQLLLPHEPKWLRISFQSQVVRHEIQNFLLLSTAGGWGWRVEFWKKGSLKEKIRKENNKKKDTQGRSWRRKKNRMRKIEEKKKLDEGEREGWKQCKRELKNELLMQIDCSQHNLLLSLQIRARDPVVFKVSLTVTAKKLETLIFFYFPASSHPSTTLM